MVSMSSNNLKLTKLYSTLGLYTGTTALEVRNAYLKLARRYHPDKNPNGQAMFIEISSAYHILVDPERRAQFLDIDDDHMYRAQVTNYVDAFAEIIAESVSRQSERRRFEKSCRDADIGLNLYVHQTVSLEEIYLGRELTIKYVRMVICQQCHGRGKKPTQVQCSNCQGRGKVNTTRRKKKKRGYTYSVVDVCCRLCSGSGRAGEFIKCDKCQGDRYVEAQATVQAKIPMGGPIHGKLRIPKRGHETLGERTVLSDLIVLVHLRHHPQLSWIGGSTIMARVSISLTEALLGFDRVLFEHLDGRKIKVSHPASRIIQPGTIKRIPGEGMRFLAATGKQNGDLMVQFKVDFPDKLTALSSDKVDQLASILGPLRLSNDAPFQFERSTENGSLCGRYRASHSDASSTMNGSNDIVIERSMIDDTLDDDIDTDLLQMRRDGFCAHCGTTPLFDEKMFGGMATCCADSTAELLFDSADVFGTDSDNDAIFNENIYG